MDLGPAGLGTGDRGRRGDHAADPDPRLWLVASTLFLVTIPIQIVFFIFLHFSGWIQVQFLFVVLFMLFFCITVCISVLRSSHCDLTFVLQVITSLFIAKWLTNLLWAHDLDPDMYAMPIQSSLVDLISQLLLVVCYELAEAMGSKVAGPNR